MRVGAGSAGVRGGGGDKDRAESGWKRKGDILRLIPLTLHNVMVWCEYNDEKG